MTATGMTDTKPPHQTREVQQLKALLPGKLEARDSSCQHSSRWNEFIRGSCRLGSSPASHACTCVIRQGTMEIWFNTQLAAHHRMHAMHAPVSIVHGQWVACRVVLDLHFTAPTNLALDRARRVTQAAPGLCTAAAVACKAGEHSSRITAVFIPPEPAAQPQTLCPAPQPLPPPDVAHHSATCWPAATWQYGHSTVEIQPEYSRYIIQIHASRVKLYCSCGTAKVHFLLRP